VLDEDVRPHQQCDLNVSESPRHQRLTRLMECWDVMQLGTLCCLRMRTFWAVEELLVTCRSAKMIDGQASGAELDELYLGDGACQAHHPNSRELQNLVWTFAR
jgi:hypothetical protein